MRPFVLLSVRPPRTLRAGPDGGRVRTPETGVRDETVSSPWKPTRTPPCHRLRPVHGAEAVVRKATNERGRAMVRERSAVVQAGRVLRGPPARLLRRQRRRLGRPAWADG